MPSWVPLTTDITVVVALSLLSVYMLYLGWLLRALSDKLREARAHAARTCRIPHCTICEPARQPDNT